ncbi:hypothetical protein EON80_29815, partial [bacterium]
MAAVMEGSAGRVPENRQADLRLFPRGGCGPCRNLDKTVWSDARVVRVFRAWVPSKADLDSQTDLATRFHVKTPAVVVFLDGKARKVSWLLGYNNARDEPCHPTRGTLDQQSSIMNRFSFSRRPLLATALGLSVAISSGLSACAQEVPMVSLARVPNGGLQPQVVVRGEVVHLIYFKGDPKAGDVFYVRSKDEGTTWSSPLQVNSGRSSALAMGTIRGPMLSVGRNGRVFVVWNGSDKATPRNPAAPASIQKYGASPLLFSRLNDAGDAFEPQRNLLTRTFNLDGGASVASDEEGRVYVAWHANEREGQDETERRVYLSTSTNDGAT